jgi:hypothetical protein
MTKEGVLVIVFALFLTAGVMYLYFNSNGGKESKIKANEVKVEKKAGNAR